MTQSKPADIFLLAGGMQSKNNKLPTLLISAQPAAITKISF
jgi:hypothetical protein